jgi:hypothetical protein
VTDGRLAANVDVAPTLLEAVGLQPDGEDGRSSISAIPRARILLEASPTNSLVPEWASRRTARYHYTEYYDRETGKIAFRETTICWETGGSSTTSTRTSILGTILPPSRPRLCRPSWPSTGGAKEPSGPRPVPETARPHAVCSGARIVHRTRRTAEAS